MIAALVLALGVASATIIYPVAVTAASSTRPAVAVTITQTPAGAIMEFQ